MRAVAISAFQIWHLKFRLQCIGFLYILTAAMKSDVIKPLRLRRSTLRAVKRVSRRVQLSETDVLRLAIEKGLGEVESLIGQTRKVATK